jgi:DNA-binding GntR family transcriptional regulator
MAMFGARLLREQVYLYLRGNIATGELSSGTPIKLSTLSKELEVSTSPLRDALMQLKFEGFVEITPRKSIVVRKLTYDLNLNLKEQAASQHREPLQGTAAGFSKAVLRHRVGVDQVRRAPNGG